MKGKKIAGILSAGLIILMIPAMCICIFFSSTIGSLFKEDQTDLFEIIVNHHSITSQFKGDAFDGWLSSARDQVYDFRKKKIFRPTSEDDDESRAAKNANDVVSTSVLFTYWVVDHTSIYPSSMTISWDDYAKCFSGEDFSAEGYDYKTDPTFSSLEELMGITIENSRRSTIIAYAKQIQGHISTDSMMDGYEENTYLDYGMDECQELWDRIFADIKANSGPYGLGHGYNRRDDPQCTDFAEWRLWLATGHGDVGGHGFEVAERLCKSVLYSSEFEYSTEPKAGAIFSVDKGEGSSGHVGYVEAVDETYITISDGNVNLKGQGHGIRINAKFTRDYFFNVKYGSYKVYFANPK